MTTPSYERINYALRPAKNMERKMIVETFSRLRGFYSLDSYRYIGFGSPYFADFSLVHRQLGIPELLCIERETDDAERFEFNRPFDCINLVFDNASAVLPALEWAERPSMIWLDYDDPMSSAILSDIDVVCASVATGSFLVVTVCNNVNDFGGMPDERLEGLRTAIGDKLPADVIPSDATPEKFGALLWRVLDSEIRYILNARGAALRQSLKFEYDQILHFDYRDGARMLTLGGVIYQNGQRGHFVQCDFESLPFRRWDSQVCKIAPPPLTFKEIRALNAQLPGDDVSLPGVPRRQIRQYAEHYRYFPNYVDAEL